MYVQGAYGEEADRSSRATRKDFLKFFEFSQSTKISEKSVLNSELDREKDRLCNSPNPKVHDYGVTPGTPFRSKFISNRSLSMELPALLPITPT
jgi:hypothetical protein